MLITGYYKDAITNPLCAIAASNGWKKNKIVNDCSKLLAALMKNQPDFDGVMYLAVGQGLLEWDNNRPEATKETSQLVDEIARFQINEDNISFVGGGAEPTYEIEVTVDIAGSDLVSQGYQFLREFGLFGGNATTTADSGYMIDYVIHPRIDLTPQDIINRQVRLWFESDSTGAQAPQLFVPSTTHWLSTSTVNNLDGVGLAYASALSAVGTTSIGDLAKMDIDTSVPNLPPMKFVELRTKARLTLRTVVNILPTSNLSNKTAWEVITTSSTLLAAEANITEVNVDKLRDQIGGLQLSMDNRFLQRTTIGELVTP